MTPTEIINSGTDTFWDWFLSSSPQQPDETRRGKVEKRTKKPISQGARPPQPHGHILVLVDENEAQ